MAWERSFEKRILDVRMRELKYQKKIFLLEVLLSVNNPCQVLKISCRLCGIHWGNNTRPAAPKKFPEDTYYPRLPRPTWKPPKHKDLTEDLLRWSYIKRSSEILSQEISCDHSQCRWNKIQGRYTAPICSLKASQESKHLAKGLLHWSCMKVHRRFIHTGDFICDHSESRWNRLILWVWWWMWCCEFSWRKQDMDLTLFKGSDGTGKRSGRSKVVRVICS